MKHPITSIILLACTTVFLSMGADGISDGGQPAPIDPIHPAPVILSERDGSNLNLWTTPGDIPAIVYDQWNIFLYGDPCDPYTILINHQEIFSGNLTRSYVNLTYDATGIDRARFTVMISNRTYDIFPLIVIHHDVGYTGIDEEDGSGGGYGNWDLRVAQFKASLGATILAVVSVYITRRILEYNRTRQGVTQI